MDEEVDLSLGKQPLKFLWTRQPIVLTERERKRLSV
jgi:hypothetical protein